MPIPNGFHSANVYLIVNDARKEIEFLKQAFAAQEGHASTMPGGSIIHAEVRLGDSTLMLGQANQAYKSQRSTVYVYLDDCDAAYRKAVEAGAKSLQEPKDQFYGDRSAGVEDSNGIWWWIATHIEDVSHEESDRRFAAMGHQH